LNNLVLNNKRAADTLAENIISEVCQQLGKFLTEAQRMTKDYFKNIENFATNLKEGDIVLTFNYDTLLERAILKKKSLASLPKYVLEENKIVIFKLHGSISWFHEDNLESIVPLKRNLFTTLEDILYVNNFDSVFNEQECLIKKAFIEPTYFKEPNSNMLKRVWREAKEVLGNANEIIIIGYSMPAGDLSARCLLQYANRKEDQRITVINPDSSLKYRFEQIFGKIDFVQTTFELSEYGR